MSTYCEHYIRPAAALAKIRRFLDINKVSMLIKSFLLPYIGLNSGYLIMSQWVAFKFPSSK
jgi:hypothetical protein